MIIMTDLADGVLAQQDWPVEAPLVKNRLSRQERRAATLLQPLLHGAPLRLAGASGAEADFWTALAVVDHAPISQYDQLLAASRDPQGLPGPLAAVALEGRGFHGNRGRPWRARRGNLHLCCAVPVRLKAAVHAVGVPAVPVVAVGDALERCAPELAWRIKWVNDLVIGGAKLAGVISAAQSRGRKLTAVVYGIGVNVAVAPEVAPTLFVPRVTCLHAHEAARGVTPGALGWEIIAALRRRLEELATAGPEPVVAAYRQRCGDVGRRVKVWAEGLADTADPTALPAPVASGRVLALDDDLALRVEGTAGPLVGGRLAHVDPVDPEELAD